MPCLNFTARALVPYQHRLLAGGCIQGEKEAALQAGTRWCHLTRRNTLGVEHEALHQTGRQLSASSTILPNPGSSFSPRRVAATNMCPPLVIGSQLQSSYLPHQTRKGTSTAVTPKSTSNQSTYLETRAGEACLAIFSMEDCLGNFHHLPSST